MKASFIFFLGISWSFLSIKHWFFFFLSSKGFDHSLFLFSFGWLCFLLYLCFEVFSSTIEDGFWFVGPCTQFILSMFWVDLCLLALVHSLWTVECITLVEHWYLDLADLWLRLILFFIRGSILVFQVIGFLCFFLSSVFSAAVHMNPSYGFAQLSQLFVWFFDQFFFKNEFFLSFFAGEKALFFFFLWTCGALKDLTQNPHWYMVLCGCRSGNWVFLHSSQRPYLFNYLHLVCSDHRVWSV